MTKTKAPTPSATEPAIAENSRRVERVARAIRSYGDDGDDETKLIDLLADARHWCDQNGLSFAKLDRLAYMHYVAELAEPS
jgi:hypothetical protein